MVDEYRLDFHRIIIGRGKPFFQPPDARIAETGALVHRSPTRKDLKTI